MSDLIDDSLTLENPNSFRSRFRRAVYQQPIVFFLVAAITGILLDHFLGPRAIVGWCILGMGCSFLSLKMGKRAFQNSKPAQVLITLGLITAVFGLNHRYQDLQYESAEILLHTTPRSQPAIVEGVILCTPRLRSHPLAEQRVAQGESPWQTVLEVDVKLFQIGETLEPMTGRIRATINGRCDARNPGDRIRLYGKLYSARVPSNPGSKSSQVTDRRNGIHARMNVNQVHQVEVIESNENWFHWHRSIAWVATRGREILLDQIGETNGPLAVALVTGQRDFVDNETSDLLLITGTAHLLSVSGMHLAIVVTLATYFCIILRMPMGLRVLTIVSVCVFYTAITGGRPPVLRAAILVSVFLVAILIRRPSQPLNTLALAGLLLLAYNPENAFAIGVQLSFLAVATLLVASGRIGHSARSLVEQDQIGVEERFDALFMTTRSRMMIWGFFMGRWIKTLAWLSLCVTAISLPLVWQQFHVVSPVSVLTNVSLGPLLFFALAFGIATVMGGMIHPLLSVVPATLCGATIWMMKQIILFAGSVPYGHAWLPAPPSVWVGVFYGVMFLLMLIKTSPGTGFWGTGSLRSVWVIGWTLVSLFLATRPAELPRNCFEATFVDVGHGTCVILRSGDEVGLYDCGRLGNEQGSSRDIDRALWSLGVTSIDKLFLSHADSDHFNSLPGLLRRFTIRQIVTPPGMLDEPERAVEQIRVRIQNADIPVIEKHSGDTFRFEGQPVRVLHPPEQRIPGSDNANSLVLQWDREGRSFVLPGDLEPPGTDVLISGPRPRPGGVLMAPHHGSLSMNADAILHWARPSQTVVSGGRLARRPEVIEMLNQFGSDVHVTAISGAVRVRILESGEIEIRTWLDSPW